MKTNSLDFDARALREKILDLAMRGKLVKQDPNDEPASVLLEKIKAEKAELVKEGKIKKSKSLPEVTDEEKPFDIPDSWEWVRLGDVVEIKGGKRVPKGKKLSDQKSYCPYIRVADMSNNTIQIKNLKYVNKEIYDQIHNYTITADDLYFSIAGTIGKVGRVPQSLNGALLTENAAKITSYQINLNYLVQILKSPIVAQQHSRILSKVAQPKLSLIKLKQTFIPLPPLEEQSRIAAKIAQLFALLRKVESSTQQYAKLQTLLKSKVLDLAMRGKLVEQDPNDEPASVLLEKEGLKESNEIPHQIPNSWSWIVLGSGAKFINGRAYKKSELLNDSSLTPILRVGNLFTNSSYYYSNLKLNPDKYIDNGDLIYAWSASFGPQIWTGGHVIYHYHIWKVIPKQIIEKQFLYYFLLDKRNVIGETDLHGSTMKHITKTNMEHLSFPLPPLSEQKRIVKKINFLLEIL